MCNWKTSTTQLVWLKANKKLIEVILKLCLYHLIATEYSFLYITINLVNDLPKILKVPLGF